MVIVVVVVVVGVYGSSDSGGIYLGAGWCEDGLERVNNVVGERVNEWSYIHILLYSYTIVVIVVVVVVVVKCGMSIYYIYIDNYYN